MEPAKIDWKRIDSRFVEDCVYEHFNAPKWVDFLAPDHSIDDHAWFCTPDCNHPKTADDFLKTSPPSQLARAATGGGTASIPPRELNQGDAKPKRRGQIQSSNFSKRDDSENQKPNLSTPPNQQARSLKGAIKSSSEKKKPIIDEISESDEMMRRLKNTVSARNLFAGRDILNHITEFCNELKKLATGAREREKEEKMSEEKIQEAVAVKEEACGQGPGQVLGELEVTKKERKPLLELGKEKLRGMEKGSAKEKERRKKSRTYNDEAENIPVSLNLENVKHKGEERLLQIRTNPPSPQCFSAPMKTTTPSKASRSRIVERGTLQEVKQNKDMRKDESTDKHGTSVSSITNSNIMDGRQARALDVFWFLKPCTMSD